MTAKQKQKNIIIKLIAGLTFTTILSIAMYKYGDERLTWIIPLIGVLASFIISKAYLLLKNRKTIEGTVIKIDKKVYMTRVRPSGDKMDGAIIDNNYPAHGYREQNIAILTLTLDNGKTITKEFICGKIVESLTIGDKISYTQLDDYPKIL